MDKEQFDELHKAFVDGWSKLARTGSTEKPDEMHKYFNSCPACECALTKTEEHGTAFADCKRCPVDLWRALAVELNKGADFGLGDAVCDAKHQWFNIWRSDYTDIYERKMVARKISEMNWTYIPELHDRKED